MSLDNLQNISPLLLQTVKEAKLEELKGCMGTICPHCKDNTPVRRSPHSGIWRHRTLWGDINCRAFQLQDRKLALYEVPSISVE